MAMLASEQVMRPVREWGLDPMYFSHVRLLAFDLLAVRPLPHMPGRFVRRGRPVRKVEMLGVVVSTDQKERYIRFILDDGTACVPCVLWMNHSRLQVTNPKRLELELQNELTMSLMRQVKLGQLLRVQGRLTVFNNQIQITVSSLQGERDPNAEVLHWMECMRLASHCYDLEPPSQSNG
ncbi:hypothetical protein CY35_05G039500 [Sphagnum magellanicum]|nr:hypothetical protein CY35_05G039500 [Sphagnum magellanicum]